MRSDEEINSDIDVDDSETNLLKVMIELLEDIRELLNLKD